MKLMQTEILQWLSTFSGTILEYLSFMIWRFLI